MSLRMSIDKIIRCPVQHRRPSELAQTRSQGRRLVEDLDDAKLATIIQLACDNARILVRQCMVARGRRAIERRIDEVCRTVRMQRGRDRLPEWLETIPRNVRQPEAEKYCVVALRGRPRKKVGLDVFEIIGRNPRGID